MFMKQRNGARDDDDVRNTLPDKKDHIYANLRRCERKPEGNEMDIKHSSQYRIIFARLLSKGTKKLGVLLFKTYSLIGKTRHVLAGGERHEDKPEVSYNKRHAKHYIRSVLALISNEGMKH